MRELDLARQRIRKDPNGPTARVLRDVISALETGTALDLASVYSLDLDNFKLVIDLLEGWWLQRHVGVVRQHSRLGGGASDRRLSAF